MKSIHKAMTGIFAATALIGSGAQAQIRYQTAPVYAANAASAGVIESIDVVRSGNEGNKVAGAILGGILGGVVGHQIGSGRGNDVATVAGALGGAAVGHQIGESKSRDTAYRVHVRLDNGDRHTFLQDDLDGLRVGDRVQLGSDRVYRYTANNDRYDTTPSNSTDAPQVYRAEAPVYRADTPAYGTSTQVYRTDAPVYPAESPTYRTDERGYRYDAEGYLIDERGYRIVRPGMRRDSQGYWIDDRGNRYDAQGFWVDERGIRHEYQDPPRTYAVPPMQPNRSN